jgi:hypothetical protein
VLASIVWLRMRLRACVTLRVRGCREEGKVACGNDDGRPADEVAKSCAPSTSSKPRK